MRRHNENVDSFFLVATLFIGVGIGIWAGRWMDPDLGPIEVVLAWVFISFFSMFFVFGLGSAIVDGIGKWRESREQDRRAREERKKNEPQT